ncbi:hypothetical protein ACFU6I_46390 [Streptomyces sp. NPDC057486]|uniref:hypothetical protein n=1 Tax=Streptomyces sp. NPDC057486 TaxID=3346145 RepID=UPI0036CDEA24
MLADECAPQHALDAASALEMAAGHLRELATRLPIRDADSADKANQVVDAITELTLSALSDLYELDDASQVSDAIEELADTADAELFSLLTGATSE